jgi:hypothetical protein
MKKTNAFRRLFPGPSDRWTACADGNYNCIVPSGEKRRCGEQKCNNRRPGFLRAGDSFLLTLESTGAKRRRTTPMGLLTNAQGRISARCWLGFACVLLIMQTATYGQGRSMSTRRTTVHWDQVPLRDAFARLSDTMDVPIFIDRRVDPEQRVNLDVQNAAGNEVLAKAATAARLGMSQLGRVTYVGPRSAAEKIRTLAAIGEGEVEKLESGQKLELRGNESVHWPRLTEPRQLVNKIVEDRRLRLAGAEQIPHDLWAAGSFQDLSLAEQLTLLLIGFDLTFTADAQQREVVLVPIKWPVAITHRYRLSRALTPDQLKQQLQGIDIRIRGDEVVAVGTVEDHQRVAHLLRPEREPKHVTLVPAKTRKLYTLRIEQQPLRRVLEQLGQRLGWTVDIDDAAIHAAGKSLDERVTFSVEDVDEDGLLRALLRPVGLQHERNGNRIRVYPL